MIEPTIIARPYRLLRRRLQGVKRHHWRRLQIEARRIVEANPDVYRIEYPTPTTYDRLISNIRDRS